MTGPLTSLDLLAAYLVVGIPMMGFLRHRRAKKQMQTGDPLAKVRFLRSLVAKQGINICLVGGLCLFAGVPISKLGVRAPTSWWLTGIIAAVSAALLIVSGLRLRAKAGKIRQTLDQRAAALLPDSITERRWFAAVCIGGGVFEELAYRGFLFYYLSLLVPSISNVEKAVVTSLLFGVGHVYQGWKGVVSTGIAGLIMASLYIVGGNLLPPIVAHILANMRILIILPRRAPSEDGG
jgi:membrane protease YdiL (CAAX protease family)